MNPIKFECPHCHEINAGDESLYGQRVNCPKCQATMLVPPPPASAAPRTARLIPEPSATAPLVADAAHLETDLFKLSPVARAFPGQILVARFAGARSLSTALLVAGLAAFPHSKVMQSSVG